MQPHQIITLLKNTKGTKAKSEIIANEAHNKNDEFFKTRLGKE